MNAPMTKVAAHIADFVHAQRSALTVHAELRHHAIHRAKLAGVPYRYQQRHEETRIWLYEPTLSHVWDHLTAMGEQPEEWGLTNREGPRAEPVSFVDQPGREETRHNPGSALLDPMKFSPRLVASTARTIDGVFEILDLGNAPALAGQPRLDRVRPSWPLRARG